MEPTFINPFECAFLVLPFIAAFAYRHSKSIQSQAITICSYAFVGWLIFFAASWHTDTQLGSWFESLSAPTPAQIDLFNRDGASKGVLFLFGLPISFCYVAVIWLLTRAITFVAQKGRKNV